jgi:beta-galactosidase
MQTPPFRLCHVKSSRRNLPSMIMTATSGSHPIERPDWNNLQVLHRNTLPPRAYFHNYRNEADALSYDSALSEALSLSGTWRFHHAPNPFESPEGFESPSFDTSSWAEIAVPGMWQLQVPIFVLGSHGIS